MPTWEFAAGMLMKMRNHILRVIENILSHLARFKLNGTSKPRQGHTQAETASSVGQTTAFTQWCLSRNIDKMSYLGLSPVHRWLFPHTQGSRSQGVTLTLLPGVMSVHTSPGCSVLREDVWSSFSWAIICPQAGRLKKQIVHRKSRSRGSRAESIWTLLGLGSNPCLVTYWLCDVGQIPEPLWASISSSTKFVMLLRE